MLQFYSVASSDTEVLVWCFPGSLYAPAVLVELICVIELFPAFVVEPV